MQWYIMQNEQPRGPYDFSEMIPLIQSQQLRSHDYIWTKGMKRWQPLAETRDFCTERLAEFYVAHKNLFERRKHPRIAIELPILIHNEKTIWPGKSISLSIGGASIDVANPFLNLDQPIYVHFRKSDHSEPFNCLAQVISKKYRGDITKQDSILNYCIRFVDLAENANKRIDSLINNQTKNDGGKFGAI